jgi:hypothetical protein
VGLTLLAAHTWSKSIDDVSTVVFPYLDNLNRAVSPGFKQADVPQNFVIRCSYDLPFGQGKKWAADASGVEGALFNG